MFAMLSMKLLFVGRQELEQLPVTGVGAGRIDFKSGESAAGGIRRSLGGVDFAQLHSLPSPQRPRS